MATYGFTPRRTARTAFIKGILNGSIDWNFIEVKEFIHLHVLVEPPERVWFMKSDEVKITCLGYGNGNLRYEWYKEYDQQVYGRMPELTLQGKQIEEDSMFLFCKIQNEEDEVETKRVEVALVSQDEMDTKLNEQKARLYRMYLYASNSSLEQNVKRLNVNKEELEVVIPNYKNYLIDIANTPLSKIRPTDQYQRHQAFLQWPTKEYKKNETYTFGSEIVGSKQVTNILKLVWEMFKPTFQREMDGVTEISLLQPACRSPHYITSVLGLEAVTKLIMDKRTCTYDEATGLGHDSTEARKTNYANNWDKVMKLDDEDFNVK